MECFKSSLRMKTFQPQVLNSWYIYTNIYTQTHTQFQGKTMEEKEKRIHNEKWTHPNSSGHFQIIGVWVIFPPSFYFPVFLYIFVTDHILLYGQPLLVIYSCICLVTVFFFEDCVKYLLKNTYETCSTKWAYFGSRD
jgi:hypothetical protein